MNTDQPSRVVNLYSLKNFCFCFFFFRYGMLGKFKLLSPLHSVGYHLIMTYCHSPHFALCWYCIFEVCIRPVLSAIQNNDSIIFVPISAVRLRDVKKRQTNKQKTTPAPLGFIGKSNSIRCNTR